MLIFQLYTLQCFEVPGLVSYLFEIHSLAFHHLSISNVSPSFESSTPFPPSACQFHSPTSRSFLDVTVTAFPFAWFCQWNQAAEVRLSARNLRASQNMEHCSLVNGCKAIRSVHPQAFQETSLEWDIGDTAPRPLRQSSMSSSIVGTSCKPPMPPQSPAIEHRRRWIFFSSDLLDGNVYLRFCNVSTSSCSPS